MMRKLWYISRFGDSALPSPHSPRKLAIPTSNDQSRAPDMSVGHIEPTFVVYTLDGPADILPEEMRATICYYVRQGCDSTTQNGIVFNICDCLLSATYMSVKKKDES